MKKVLIANRGEIAVRIISACHDLGLQTVAVYSQADSEALHVVHADEAICIGEAPANKSYLKIPNIISACEITGADAVHPGYGFLSENANFASICESCGLVFIGPSPQTISLLGDKAMAKSIAKSVKCPIIPGSDGVVKDLNEAKEIAKKIGCPLLVKAVAGGGGRGIRVVLDIEDFARQFTAAKTEAEAAFGNGDVYLEKMILNPRHIEVQVLGDKHGNYIHLGERDCTIQRRRQKLIEESPSPILSESQRKKICESAVAVVKAAKYFSAGTVEFLLDEQKNFYFMEVNTRIQVEHTVSEILTGVDIVSEQIKVAMGKKLEIKQKDVIFKGHVIQCRINAEDPANNFSPSPGVLDHYIPPCGPHIRIDSACYTGYKIPPNYDSMIAKLIITGKDRESAIKIARRALKQFHVGGVRSTIPFHMYMLRDENFQKGEYFIDYVDQLLAEGCRFTDDSE